MLARELINNVVPPLKLSDTAASALQLMAELKITHLPVVEEDKFLGMISEDDLLDEENQNELIQYFQDDFIPVSVKSGNHFLHAVNACNHYQTNVIPVINESNEFLGTIDGQQLLVALAKFSGADETGAVIELEMERSRFSISEINRIVESDGALILHLNITSRPETSVFYVTLHLNKKEISTIIAAFERYEYTVSYFSGDELFDNELDLNFRHLMNYLDI